MSLYTTKHTPTARVITTILPRNNRDDLSQDTLKWRDDVPLFQQMETVKSYTTKHTPTTRVITTTLPRNDHISSNSNIVSRTKISDKLKGQDLNLPL